MNQLKEKKLNNKGFSLVELIIVIAIMAVLVGVLAPQYMRYVERSRLSTDNSALDSAKTAIEAALADPTIYEKVVAATADPVVTFSSTGYTWTNGVTELTNEFSATMGAASDVKMKSKTYNTTSPTITVDHTSMKVTIAGMQTTP